MKNSGLVSGEACWLIVLAEPPHRWSGTFAYYFVIALRCLPRFWQVPPNFATCIYVQYCDSLYLSSSIAVNLWILNMLMYQGP